MRSLLFAAIDNWLDGLFAPAPDPAKVGWLREWEYAHRGLHGKFDGRVVPENSTAAFAAAIDRGMGIECDVQAGSGFQPVIFHDWELDRLTDKTGPLLNHTAGEISKTTLSANGEPIPQLADLLEQIGGKVPLLIEVKSRRKFPVERLCSAMLGQLATYDGEFAVMSFDPRVSRWFARKAPEITRGLVMKHEHFPQWYGYPIRRLSLWYAKPDFLAHDIRDLPTGLPASQRLRGLPVISWAIRTPQLREHAAIHADAPIAEGAGLP